MIVHILVYMIVQENSSTGALVITIPKAIAKAKKIKKGTKAEWVLDDNGKLFLEVGKRETNNA